MALFPKCTFEVLLTGGGVVPGERAEGTLVLHAPAVIPRADHIQFDFVSAVHASYGSANHRERARQEMYRGAFRIDLPEGELAAGTHRFPFWLDIPAWLPPGITGNDYALGNVIQTSLDVHWAIDPKESFIPQVLLPARTGELTPAILRSPQRFHQDLVLEATLESSVVVLGEPLRGRLALRGGFAARFDFIDISYVSMAKMVFARGDLRACAPPTLVRIPADALRSGASIAFELPCPEQMLPTLRNSFINHEAYCIVRAIVPWQADPAFEWNLDVLPRGSHVVGRGRAAPVGNERLSGIAAAMAGGSGLRPGRGRELVVGDVGPVHVAVVDAPRNAVLGVDVDFTFPDVQLDIRFHSQSAFLSAFAPSPLLPASLTGYSLSVGREEPELAAFFASILHGLESARDIRLSDHHLGFHHALTNDETPRMVAIAKAARERAQAIQQAILVLPFPALAAEARSAWIATAAEQEATLVPSGPSLHGIAITAKILGGEERRLVAAIRTTATKRGPEIRCDIDLRNAPLPETVFASVESDDEPESELLRAVRATFPRAQVLSEGNAVTLERAAWTPDPRILLPALEAFLWFLLGARGERRVESPYR